MTQKLFYPFAILYTMAIVYMAWSTPISPHEAKFFYEDQGVVSTLMWMGDGLLSRDIFGSFLGIRVSFILLGISSIYLYYKVSEIYLSKERDIYLSVTIYMLLPGIITATVLANISMVVIPLVLLFVWAYNKGWLWMEALLMVLIFMAHEASIIFFIAIFIYSLVHKESQLTILSGILLFLFLLVDRGVAIGGRPAGYFADMFGLYSALFSPLIFIYFFYTMYRILLREEKNILWYISFIALVASLVLSVRQRIVVTDFAPYVIISVVLMLDTFNKSLRIRLLEYRRWYRVGYSIAMLTLIVSSLTIFFHKSLFYVIKDPQKHFAAKLYEPYWLASRLKKDGIECYDAPKKYFARQLKFYGIESCR
ncbi:membrane protein [hydrothermal vent metagenome]|uniref:Membrane protein n=1 Tax=hydrothermal vent metagenome TaxID=652676 RepID=A0A1W1C9I1_9ZZZZ